LEIKNFLFLFKNFRINKNNYFKKICFNERGQASLVDSIIFLTIVSSVVTMLFFFMIGYGDRVEKQINSVYTEDFSMDTLKVITYINVLRDGKSVFDYDYEYSNQNSPEHDYLLTMIKEDHADIGAFSSPTKQAVVSTISSVLQPFEESLDYAFFILQEDSDKFSLLIFAIHEGLFNEDGDLEEVNRVYYDCNPDNSEILATDVFPNVGKVNSAVGKVMLTHPNSEKNVPFLMSLNLWVSSDISVFKNMAEPDVENGIKDFNCVKIDMDDI
jgi:hypothetical protein